MKRRLLIIAVFLLLGTVREPRLLRVIVSLLLGVVTTVGVAWLCAATAECEKQSSFFVADPPGASSVPFFVLVHRRSGFGLDQVAYPPTYALEWQRLGLDVQDARPHLPRWAVWPKEPAHKTTLYVAAGWPLKAVVCHSLASGSGLWRWKMLAASSRQDQRSGFAKATWTAKPTVWKDAAYVIEDQPSQFTWVPGWGRSRNTHPPIAARVLPLRPLLLGFTINTLFYAALLWPLICVPLALRGLLRVSRGLCPKCAYPMGDSPVCTECGRLLPKRVAT